MRKRHIDRRQKNEDDQYRDAESYLKAHKLITLNVRFKDVQNQMIGSESLLAAAWSMNQLRSPLMGFTR